MPAENLTRIGALMVASLHKVFESADHSGARRITD
jgi:hypothetical protein